MKPEPPRPAPPPGDPRVDPRVDPRSDRRSDRRFAKDLAKQLERRRLVRRLFVWTVLVAAIVLAALYATCGSGFGLGGKGKGKGKGAGLGPGPGSASSPLAPIDAGPRRCALRVASNGITADGVPITVPEAVATCKTAADTDVVVTGGARQADWETLEAALKAAHIQFRLIERGGGSAGPGTAPASTP